ncbi:Glutaredoxin domain-containing protein [Psidium guajava]|nr:Glutaredoxin domain-containing protein [Psidium guajava]
METSLRFRHEHRLPTPTIHAPPPSANCRPLPRGHGDRATVRADLNMRRACAHPRIAIRGGRSIFAFLTPNNPIATSSARPLGFPTEASANKGVKREDVEDEKRSAPAPPRPPPERPSPGDCCGSGCVRCVWDVYYEELEAYNQSLREDEGSGSNSNPS